MLTRELSGRTAVMLRADLRSRSLGHPHKFVDISSILTLQSSLFHQLKVGFCTIISIIHASFMTSNSSASCVFVINTCTGIGSGM